MVYETLLNWQHDHSQTIDLVICCGDFQSLRDEKDMEALECPQKFKRLGDLVNGEAGSIVASLKESNSDRRKLILVAIRLRRPHSSPQLE